MVRPRVRSAATTAAKPIETVPAAFRPYASVTDSVLRGRRGPTGLLVAGLGLVAVVAAGTVLLSQQASHPRAPLAAPVVAAPAPVHDAPAPVRDSGRAAPRRPAAAFQVAGVHIAARRVPGHPGVQRVTITPAAGAAREAATRTAVLHDLVTGATRARLTTARFRHRPATLEHYRTRAGVRMTALCVQWTRTTVYVLRAPSAGFADVARTFRAG